jgi:hypothetical protein
MKSIGGPKYDLHTTVWGLDVEEPDYYVRRCFDYVITSSYITKRYATGVNRERFPKSAHFYQRVDSDPKFRKIYSIEPVEWRREGPVINIYKVTHQCVSSSQQHPGSQH